MCEHSESLCVVSIYFFHHSWYLVSLRVIRLTYLGLPGFPVAKKKTWQKHGRNNFVWNQPRLQKRNVGETINELWRLVENCSLSSKLSRYGAEKCVAMDRVAFSLSRIFFIRLLRCTIIFLCIHFLIHLSCINFARYIIFSRLILLSSSIAFLW